MKKFEYLVEALIKGEYDELGLEMHLCELGEQGWELISSFINNPEWKTLVFKREVQDERL